MSFSTKIDITGDDSEPLPADAVKRMVALYVISHLRSEPLDEACQSLAEIYEFHRQNEAIVHQQPLITTQMIVPAIVQMQPRAFAYEEDA